MRFGLGSRSSVRRRPCSCEEHEHAHHPSSGEGCTCSHRHHLRHRTSSTSRGSPPLSHPLNRPCSGWKASWPTTAVPSRSRSIPRRPTGASRSTRSSPSTRAGVATAPAATAATAGLAAHINDYITGEAFGDAGSHYAGPIGKSMLAATLAGRRHPLLRWCRPRGALTCVRSRPVAFTRVGSPTSPTFGDFSNGFGQALNILALSHTRRRVPGERSRLPAGSTVPGRWLPPVLRRRDPADSTRVARATTKPTPTPRRSHWTRCWRSIPGRDDAGVAIAGAATWLIGQQDPITGGFHGTGPTAAANTNTTGLAAQALNAAGFVESQQRSARDYVGSLQLNADETTGTPAAGEEGAIALNPATFDDAAGRRHRRCSHATSGVGPRRRPCCALVAAVRAPIPCR